MSKIISVILGVTFSFLLFVVMTYLVKPDVKGVAPVKDNPTVVFLYKDVDDPINVNERIIPKLEHEPEPKFIKTLSKQPVRQVKNVSFQPFKIERASFKGKGAFSSFHGGTEDGEAIAQVQINPRYPRNAATQGIEGYVTLKFDVAADGSTENISVIKAKPRGTFERAAVKALRKWRYKPKMENGKSVAQLNQTMTLEFNLESEHL
jgi:protein TonB